VTDVMMGEVFAILTKFAWPWAQSQLAIFWLKFLMETNT